MTRRFFFPGELKTMALSGAPRKGSVSSKGRKTVHPNDVLKPIRKKPKVKTIMVYDFESRDDDHDMPGFTRPFQVGFLDHEGEYRSFFQESEDDFLYFIERGDFLRTEDGEAIGCVVTVGRKGDFRKRTMAPGGCVDRFLRHVLELHPSAKGKRRFHPDWTSDVADIYAHNGGRFDATFLLTWLYRHRNEFGVKITCIQGRAAAVTVWPKFVKKPKVKDKISFLDSALIFPNMKLSKVTSLFSKGAKKAEFDQKTTETDREKWEEYNRYDCVGLRDAILGFRDLLESEGGELSMTAPSASMKLFRRRFLRRKIPRGKHFPGCENICQGCVRGEGCDGECHGCLHQWIRQGYFGGRVEIFERFAPAPVFYYDINSSYPASMLEPMPIGDPICVQVENEFLESHERMRAEGKLAFVECTVKIPLTCPIPPLPYLHEGKLKFPSGIFSGVFEYDELSLLFDPFVNGQILHIEKALWFEGAVIFDEFVDTLYRYKEAGSKAKLIEDPSPEDLAKISLGELAKLMLNSLYGKFGMNEEREEVVFVGKEDPWPKDARPIDGRHQTCNVWVKPAFVDPSYVIPQLPARITALSRARWWRAAKRIVLDGGRVFYGDTDAILCSIPFPSELIHGTKLGLWKQEHEDEYFEGEFVLPKFYLLQSNGKQIVHMKGVLREFQTAETFRFLVDGGELKKERAMTSQPKTVLRKLSKEDGPDGIFMIDSVKKLRSTYDKRVVHGDGTTSPLVLEEV